MKGKVAIVITGSIRGIGRGITECFMSLGVNVLAVYFGGPEEAGPAITELNATATEKAVAFHPFLFYCPRCIVILQEDYNT